MQFIRPQVVDLSLMKYAAGSEWGGRHGDTCWDIAFAAALLSLELFRLLSLWGCP